MNHNGKSGLQSPSWPGSKNASWDRIFKHFPIHGKDLSYWAVSMDRCMFNASNSLGLYYIEMHTHFANMDTFASKCEVGVVLIFTISSMD